jgi:lipopolysaccharide transport system ATP-binding protein
VTTTVAFRNVSKKYQLGLTRNSLPSIVSAWVGQLRHPARVPPPERDEFWALRDVSFELNEGESMALLGANGAGKTTILKLLAQITRPTRGTVGTAGQLSALIELGAGFHPDLTGRENIFLNAAILGLSRNEIGTRFDEIVAFSELEPFLATPVKRYSSGMAVRLGFAVAACIQPQILLVDEVLAVGDAAFQQKCMNRIRSLLDSGTSMIFVSHNMYLVQAVCRRALYLDRGRVQYLGDTKQAIDLYEHDVHQDRARSYRAAIPGHSQGSGNSVTITQVEVLGPNGRADRLPAEGPVRIDIHYVADQRLGQVQASAFIRRSDGLTCCTLRTKLAGFELSLERGEGVVSLWIDPLQLTTGAYFVEAWFLNASDSMSIVDQPQRSGWFYVHGSGLTYDNNGGVFEPHARWEHRSVEASRLPAAARPLPAKAV